MMTRFMLYCVPLSPHQLQKNRHCWTPSDKTFWIRACTPSLNAHADTPSRAGGPRFNMSLALLPLFVYARSEGSGEAARVHMLV